MRKTIAFLLAALTLTALVSCGGAKSADTTAKTETGALSTAAPEDDTNPQTPGKLTFDFSGGDEGFTAIYADLPGTRGIELFYELESAHKDVPIEGAGKGMFITGNNHSDDLFMGFYKELSGFEAGKSYKIDLKFRIATDVEGGMIGIGGSPGESVYIKCGAVSEMPIAAIEGEYYRMSIDTGSQSSGGKDMKVVGNIAKQQNDHPGEFEFNSYGADFEVTADGEGKLWLIIASDSGFEGISAYYLDDVEVGITPA